MKKIIKIKPNSFEPENHWYEKSLNATIHPTISYFMNLSKERIVKRYCHLNPKVKQNDLLDILSYKPKYYHLSGADLLHVTTEEGKRQMVIIENNSCPSGQKSMPLLDEFQEQGGYKIFVEKTIKPLIKNKRKGVLAVIYDKNYMEASGYAFALADALNEEVYLVPFYNGDKNEYIKNEGDKLSLFVNDEWKEVALSFRYLTQKPWNRLPIFSKT